MTCFVRARYDGCTGSAELACDAEAWVDHVLARHAAYEAEEGRRFWAENPELEAAIMRDDVVREFATRISNGAPVGASCSAVEEALIDDLMAQIDAAEAEESKRFWSANPDLDHAFSLQSPATSMPGELGQQAGPSRSSQRLRVARVPKPQRAIKSRRINISNDAFLSTTQTEGEVLA